jgi:hypothetical protein
LVLPLLLTILSIPFGLLLFSIGNRLLLIASGKTELMDDSAIILRMKFKTKPGDQFVVRREVYRRIQERSRTQGIEFAHRNVTGYLTPEVTGAADEDGQAP